MIEWRIEIGGLAVIGALFLAVSPWADALWTCVILGTTLIALDVKIIRVAHPEE